jgi:hypothetical protein
MSNRVVWLYVGAAVLFGSGAVGYGMGSRPFGLLLPLAVASATLARRIDSVERGGQHRNVTRPEALAWIGFVIVMVWLIFLVW